MRTPIAAAAMAATLVLACAPVQAESPDIHAEVMEWVIEPCMEVSATLDMKSYTEEQIESGIKRTHIAQVMAASRDAAARDVASKMKTSATWRERRAAYPVMLRICLQQQLDK